MSTSSSYYSSFVFGYCCWYCYVFRYSVACLGKNIPISSLSSNPWASAVAAACTISPPPRLSIISRPLSARFTLSHCLWFSSTLFLSQSSPSLLILLLFLPFVFSLSADFPPNNLRVRMWMSVPLMSIFNHKWSIWLVCMKDNCELIKIIIS